ncbi:MAG: peptide ABC transporter ATP-binding protein [Acidobacteria bacterium]|nr:MAG: peptide ABC transporter ATP-binding protein [Acidobacteriota bacterium]
MPGPLLHVKDLRVRYLPESGGKVQALEGLNLEILPGEVTGILGESGSGKSTLASTLLRLLPASAECSGCVVFEGEDLLTAAESKLRRIRGSKIALIPQDPAVSLNPVTRVGEQISEVLRAHLRLSRSERKQRVRQLLVEVGFEDVDRIVDAYLHQLSGGQRQRVVIAQAIACRPSLIIADEPTSKLHSELHCQILALLANTVAQHDTALLLITHDPTILAGFADRLMVMYAGRLIEQGPAESVMRRPLHPYTRALIGLSHGHTSGNRASHLPSIPGEMPNPLHVMPGCRFEPRCSEKMGVCATTDPQTFSPESSRLVSCLKYGN